MPDGTVCAIAAHYILRDNLTLLAILVQVSDDPIGLLDRRNKRGVVFDLAIPRQQLLYEEPLRHILGNHRNEGIRRLFWFKSHVYEPSLTLNDSDRGHPVRHFQEGIDNARHIEDLECAWKNCKRLGVLRLRRPLFNETPL